MIKLPPQFLSRMSDELGVEYQDFVNSYNRSPYRAIRVNTLKISVEKFKTLSPFKLGAGVPWEKNGFYADGENLGKNVMHAAGLYYVQEPSAMSPATELDVRAGDRVLDLCSAPGGKGTQLAQSLNGCGVLVLNEISPKRYDILHGNVERLGVKNAVITCESPQKLAGIFKNYFDKILVDAPCSGEGMFLKEERAISEWSLESVRACAVRQAEILESADAMLSGGGKLVYSTCTFAPEEDELQIENFLKNHAEYSLLKLEKLYPHKVMGEGHFYAVLQKSGDKRADIKTFPAGECKVYREWERENLNISLPEIFTGGKGVYCVSGLPDVLKSGVRCACGVYLGSVSNDGKRFEPSHAFAMSLKRDEAKTISVNERTALNYLRGLTFECPSGVFGWRLVTYQDYPLGWCKCLQGVAKNHLPKGLRI